MAILRFFWLGPPAIEYDGSPLRLEMRKTLALLAYLSLSPLEPTRETLAALLWPEYDQQHALANLRRNLASLAKSLPLDILNANRERIGLKRVGSFSVDVEDYREELALTNQHSHPANDLCPECRQHLEKALGLYRGNFLAGFNLKDCPEFDEWQYFQRESLLAEYAGALKKLASYLTCLGQLDKAIAHTRSWVAIDRLHEPAQRQLISLLAQSGQRRAARRQYEEFVQYLQAELGQKPEPETIELRQAIESIPRQGEKTAAQPELGEPAPRRGLEPLLKTKLYIPFSKGEKVTRGQLLTRLNQIQDQPLTILSAPAGFGKTTLLSEWIKQTLLPVGWLSLDEADNHLVRFLTYLIAAIQSLEPDFGAEVQIMLGAPEPLLIQATADHLISALEKISMPVVLVLDDYQVIQERDVHKFLASILDQLPGNTHVVISTRVDPPLNLARWRAHGKLLEIRTQELRFTTAEIHNFCNDIMGLGISPAEISILDERTEGWAVGLQMAALSLQKSPDRSQTIQAFSGSNRYILDYFLEEVLTRQPEYIQEFLLQTSILEQLNGPLCEAVTRFSDRRAAQEQPTANQEPPRSSQAVLEYLERANLFILSLDDERCWYRYHRLFGELLRARLEHFYPQLVNGLHRRASKWYEQNGYIPAAIRHALASAACDYAAEVLERAIRTNFFWGSGDIAQLLSWVESLPEEIITSKLKLRIEICAALYVAGQFKTSYRILTDLGNSLSEALKIAPDPAFVEQLYLSFRILHEATLGNISSVNEHWAKLQAIERDDEMITLLSRNYRLLAYLVAGEVENALRITRPAYEGLSARGYVLQALSNAKNTAEVYLLQGRLTDAIEICEQAIESSNLRGTRNPIIGVVKLPLAEVLLEKDELEQAERCIQEAIDLLMRGPIGNDFGTGYALLARIKQAQGDGKQARYWIEKALQQAEYAGIPRVLQLIQAYQARIWLGQGEITPASNWANAYQRRGLVEYPREVEDLTLAQVFIAQQRYSEAGDLLANLLEKARAAGRFGRVIEILVHLARLYFAQGQTEKATAFLEESLPAACLEKYARVYLDRGESMRHLLEHYLDTHQAEKATNQLEKTALSSFAKQLLLAFERHNFN